MKTKRIGIFSGTFDPIHIGHIEACLVAKGALELVQVCVMIEKKPKRKDGVTDYKHRKKMVELALDDFDTINFLDANTDNITFEETQQLLSKKFPGYQFVMIVGSDMLDHIEDWPGFEQWATKNSVAIVLRSNSEEKVVKKKVAALDKKLGKTQITVLPAVWSPISSSKIRSDIKKTGHSDLVHRQTMSYIKEHKLY